MSGGQKNAHSLDDGCECVASSNDVEVMVIRSADGKTDKITIPLSSTLNALKDAIDSNRTLGPLQRSKQRIFHLGRELKSGSRSLSVLGIGKHGVFSVHLHSLAPGTVESRSEGEKTDERGGARGKADAAAGGGVIDLASSASEAPRSDGGGDRHGNAHGRRQRQQQRQQQQQPPQQHPQRRQRQRGGEREKVVELLDSDSDDDVVEVVETGPKRRRRT